jgi:CDP-2,3-bis-(O-geranylgeranyl)-sn-glycerol synthase
MLLLFVANGAPIILNNVLGRLGAWPVDGGATWSFDGQPVLGPSKTWRGVAAALLATAGVAWLLALPFRLGLIVGAFAMLGDLLSSFVKRRRGMASGNRALGLDQIPESLLPLLAVRAELSLSAGQVSWLVLAFLVLELLLSRLLFAVRIRERPY